LALKTPVLLIIFRRPELTRRVLDAVRAARPRRLFVVADGPRPGRPEDQPACKAARAVIDEVDWPCQIERCYLEQNLGCGRGPSCGISWVFEQVPEAIILEDDCVPDPSFFFYAQELLERYRDDDRVMHISGCTYRAEPWDTPHSYFFSKFPACWGWATWRRAWQHFDLHVGLWPSLKPTAFLESFIHQPRVEAFWAKQFDGALTLAEDLHYWDYQWAFACWAHSGLSIFPRHNLISNIGSGSDATHTFDERDQTLGLATRPLAFPLTHPPSVLRDADLDRQYVAEFLLPAVTPRAVASSGRFHRGVSRYAPNFAKRAIRRLKARSR